jgi:hypothetical protein
MSASNVIGQAAFGDGTPTTPQSGLNNGADHVFYDPGTSRLFVVDGEQNQHVMIFDGSYLPPWTSGYN